MFVVEDLTFRYPKNPEDTLKGLTFEVGDGEIFGLLGPSGVGKSTTQKVMVKILGGYGGSIKYRGRTLAGYDRDFYQRVGVGFEMPVHFSKLTAQENLDFFARLYERTADIESLLRRLGLYEDRHKRVAEFSKGMKIRLNFARALLNEPSVLFLDEPTMGLDPMNARVIKQMIREFRSEGGTVLLTTHLMNDVDELCDQVAFMADGRIAEIESPKNLKLRYGQRRVNVEYESDGVVRNASFDLDGLGDDDGFLNVVRNHRILTMHSQETTLDDIFIEVTGMKAR